jgi:signal transduction histidine kinase
MRRLNRTLAALAIAVLIGTLWLLSWLRQRADQAVDHAIEQTLRALPADQLLHGGSADDTLVHFAVLERAIQRALEGPYFIDIRATIVSGGRESPIVPFKWRVDAGEPWRDEIAGWPRFALSGSSGAPYGYLYIHENRSVQRTLNWAIGTTSLAIVLMLTTLLARLWSQETSLTRTTIELNERRHELIRLERLALAGQLAAGLLHDLRKPVLNIQHGVDELAEALGDYAPAAPALAEQRRQARLFFEILSDSQMERFVQSDRVGEEYLEVVGLIDFALSLVRYERRAVEVVRKETDGLPPILGQPFRLIQLFSNLILNAYQAMGGQGRLTIEADRAPWERGRPARTAGDTRRSESSAVSSPLRTPASSLGIEVRFSDSGTGIAPEHLPRIFDPFFTTKPEGEGTGLGLSICKMIVEEMGGRLAAENHPDGGACFRVWLPAEAEVTESVAR